MVKLIGIDDAGRGPVIGPMILAGILIDENEHDKVRELGVKDSKLLSASKRATIRRAILESYTSHLEISEPKEIDESSNLNYLEAVKSAMIINKLSKGITEPIKVIIDCPSVNIESWTEDVKKLVDNKSIQVISEHKADFNHPIVSAASILAKEKREEMLVQLKEELQVDFGSGYPADPKTKKFIEENYYRKEYKKIIRFSWNTVKRILKSKGQQALF